MPTYYANGVTATLSICDLQDSLSNGINLKQGAAQQANAKRLQKVFSSAQKLSERPVGQDGSSKGVLQFIGIHADMPLYIVEAGEFLGQIDGDADVEMQDAHETGIAPSGNGAWSSDDSPLTSLATTPATPTPTKMQLTKSFPEHSLPAFPKLDPVIPFRSSPIPAKKSASSEAQIDPSSMQALVLDVTFSQKSFLAYLQKDRLPEQGFSRGLKIEVFVNGQLADVSFVNEIEGRRLAIQVVGKDHVRFAGTRIHRQVEKPWVYAPQHVDHGASNPIHKSTEAFWDSVCAAYVEEADNRGRDRFGSLPPSADFLMGLAGLQLPQHLKAHRGLGIVDVLITVGGGRKYGPDTTYLTKPTRLIDTTFPHQEPTFPSGPLDFSSILPVNDDPLFDSRFPGAPLSQRDALDFQYTISPDMGSPNAISPNTKQTLGLGKEFGLNIDPKKAKVGGYQNAHGNVGKTGRSLGQRLGDLKKMSAKNRDIELQKLKDEFGVQSPSPPKMQRLDELKQGEFERFLTNSEPMHMPSVTAMPNVTIDPAKMMKQPMQLPPEGSQFEAFLTRNRIDMALNGGAASDGPLIRKITSSSPQHSPFRRTEASALLSSPTHTPVKVPKRRGRPPKTPKRQKMEMEPELDASPLTGRVLKSAAKSGDESPSRSSGRGANRSGTQGEAKEQNVPDKLKAFEVPENCKGSCVTYDEDEGVARQIGKARGGEFREETVLVGMRFVVV